MIHLNITAPKGSQGSSGSNLKGVSKWKVAPSINAEDVSPLDGYAKYFQQGSSLQLAINVINNESNDVTVLLAGFKSLLETQDLKLSLVQLDDDSKYRVGTVTDVSSVYSTGSGYAVIVSANISSSGGSLVAGKEHSIFLNVKGDTGFQGFQGHQGLDGNRGTQGVQGNRGVQGDIVGNQGPQGPDGHLGHQGPQGANGPAGHSGSSGAQGPQGGPGPQGPQGSQGHQGFQGIPGGPQGIQGVQGPQGYSNYGGDRGVQGSVVGHQGHPGPHRGYQGYPGHTGDQGTQGFQGIPGPQGPIGAQGPQGPQGPQGFQGNEGFQGNRGLQGHQGFDGFIGFQGSQGHQGSQGLQGPQGVQGDQGSQGTQGSQGNQGFQGLAVQGPQGSQGNQGFQGTQGVQGAQGNQGFKGEYGGAQGPQGVQGVTGNSANTYMELTPVSGSSTMLLLHMNGDNNGTKFLDSSSTPITVNIGGAAKTSTTTSKFGISSGYFNGSGDYLYCDGSAEFNLANKDFTIETWLNFSAVPNSSMGIINAHNHNITFDWGVYINSSTQIGWYGANGTSSSLANIPTITTGTWYHLAVVRNSDTVRIYWNGTQYGSGGVSNAKYTGIGIAIGCDRLSGPQSFFNGYMDELRISHTARYTSNFTPPTQEFPTEDGTASLPVSPKAGDIVHTNQGVFICSSESPVAWKKYAIVPT